MFENRCYVFFDVSELNLINFDEVLETSAETVRRSVDGTKTFIKWGNKNEVPQSVRNLTTKGPYLTHDEIMVVLGDEFWSGIKEEI